MSSSVCESAAVRMGSSQRAALADWAIAGRSRPGQRVSGDIAVATIVPDGVVVAALDGLGHGEETARAARTAAAVVEGSPVRDLRPLVRSCHEALTRTRGASLALGFVSTAACTLTWLGVGSVEGRIVGRRRHETLDARPGLAGGRLPTLVANTLELRHGDTVILATDGVHHRFADALDLAGRPAQIAERILSLHWKRTDDAVVLVVRFLGQLA